jgi:hypothetical protein
MSRWQGEIFWRIQHKGEREGWLKVSEMLLKSSQTVDRWV